MIRVGPAGWSYRDWEGVVYPRPKPRGFHPLGFLAQFFQCLEINSTFYAPARGEHAELWAREVEDLPDFRFTAKLHRDFTHLDRAAPVSQLQAEARSFLAGLERAVAAGGVWAGAGDPGVAHAGADGPGLSFRSATGDEPLFVGRFHRMGVRRIWIGARNDLSFGHREHYRHGVWFLADKGRLGAVTLGVVEWGFLACALRIRFPILVTAQLQMGL